MVTICWKCRMTFLSQSNSLIFSAETTIQYTLRSSPRVQRLKDRSRLYRWCSGVSGSWGSSPPSRACWRCRPWRGTCSTSWWPKVTGQPRCEETARTKEPWRLKENTFNFISGQISCRIRLYNWLDNIRGIYPYIIFILGRASQRYRVTRSSKAQQKLKKGSVGFMSTGRLQS